MEFLTLNMKDLELELRAHSMVLEAVQQGVIDFDQISGSLVSARQSPTMLGYVEEKYRQVAERLANDEKWNSHLDEMLEQESGEDSTAEAAPTRRNVVH